jgi:hypothetical protein
MCLTTFQANPTIATRDIYVFKVLRVTRRNAFGLGPVTEILSPYMYSAWKIGKLRRALMKVTRSYYRRSYSVEDGLHAYTTFRQADRCSNKYSTFIFVAKIPKGAKYYRGRHNDIVADRMIILDRKHPESLERLRISNTVSLSF